MKTPILETERLRLRPLSLEDAQSVFYCWESDPDVAKYMFWTSHHDINRTKEWLAFETSKITADDWFRWGFVEKETGALIGTGLIYLEEEFGLYEIGYNLGKKFWGKGFTTEAMRAIIRFSREELCLSELVGRHATENKGSENVMKKLGFEYLKDCSYPCSDGKVMMAGREYRLKLAR